jgi:hypothetical protein
MARPSKPKPVSIKKPKKLKVDWGANLLQQIIDSNAIPIPMTEDHVIIEVPVQEYQFHPKRKWRFDLAFLKNKLAVEIEGGIWIMGRHNRGVGMIKDMEKYNEASYYGWYMARFTPKMVKDGIAMQFLNKYFRGDKQIE